MEHHFILPIGFTMRAATLADAQAVCDLLNDCAIAETGLPEASVNELRTFWQMPDFDPSNGTQVVLSPQQKIVGYADVDDTHIPPVSILLFGRVHPDFLGQGIGTALMTWEEERARQAIPKVTGDLRVVTRCHYRSHHTPSEQLLTAHGMKIIRHSWHMGIDLAEAPPTPQWPPGITLKTRQGLPDLLPIYRAVRESFRDHFGYVEQPEAVGLEQFAHWVNSSEIHDPSLWFLAMDGEEMAAVALCQPQSDEDAEKGWMSTLGVRRPWRQRGLGLALLQHAFGEFYRRGKKRVGLGVDASNLTGATRLYEKAGMFIDQHFDLYEKELRPGRDISRQTAD